MNTREKLAASRLLGEMEKQAFKAEALKQFGSRALNAMGRGEAWNRFGRGIKNIPGNFASQMSGKGADAVRPEGLAGRLGELLGLSGMGVTGFGIPSYLKGRSSGRKSRDSGGQLSLPLDYIHNQKMKTFPEGPTGIHERMRRTNRGRAPGIPNQDIILGPGGRRS